MYSVLLAYATKNLKYPIIGGGGRRRQAGVVLKMYKMKSISREEKEETSRCGEGLANAAAA